MKIPYFNLRFYYVTMYYFIFSILNCSFAQKRGALVQAFGALILMW